jgi:DNA-binding CsgD family transcriptional regulator
MLKDAPPRQLAEAVRTVSAGESLLAPAVTRRLIERYVSRPPAEAVRRERFAGLTERELEVLTLLTRGLSNVEIGERLFVSEATVKTHVTRVLSKLGVRDRVQAVVLAYMRADLPSPAGMTRRSFRANPPSSRLTPAAIRRDRPNSRTAVSARPTTDRPRPHRRDEPAGTRLHPHPRHRAMRRTRRQRRAGRSDGRPCR